MCVQSENQIIIFKVQDSRYAILPSVDPNQGMQNQTMDPQLVSHAVEAHHRLLSDLAIVCIVSTMNCKRFARALANNTMPPRELSAGLAKTMKMAREQALTVPAGLQSKVSTVLGSEKAN